jgi:hypothetical protein
MVKYLLSIQYFTSNWNGRPSVISANLISTNPNNLISTITYEELITHFGQNLAINNIYALLSSVKMNKKMAETQIYSFFT